MFVKFRECNALNQPWTHGQISTTLTDHTFPNGIEPVLSDGSAVGIDASPNNLGVMLRHTATGTFPVVGPYTITLRVTNLPNTSGTHDLSVIGIEMVFIPQESYSLGTLSGWAFSQTEAAFAFDQNGSEVDPHQPYTINSENAITLTWAGANGSSINVPADFPKGFRAFHIMKYEISQGQYAAFLNMLPGTVANIRYVSNYGVFRNQLAGGGAYPYVYQSNRQDRAQNFLSWHDLCAYLDWAALRPITEMEYEKVCRGPGQSNGEYAWGTTNIWAGSQIGIVPENGTEVFTDPPNANCTCNGGVGYTGGDGGTGPVRVGIHAKVNSSSREASGASYYGVMDMTGNLGELVVMVSSNSGEVGSPGYRRLWGDGVLDWNTGRADQANWPLGNPGGFGVRGGSWASWPQGGDLRVSSRWHCRPEHTSLNNRDPDYRDATVGGRGAR